MLFDLKGKRRRAVQGTYLTLAILMGAGLVLFGIGSSVNGGLSDLFSGGGGSNQGDKIVQDRIDKAEKQLAVDPANVSALKSAIQGHYQLAQSDQGQSGKLSDDGRAEVQQATALWQKYLATNPEKPDVAVARYMVQVYSALATSATGDNAAADAQTAWAGASRALEFIAAAKPTWQNYVQLVQAATLAGQSSKANLAGKKAIEVAPKAEKKQAKQQVAQAKAANSQQPGATGATAP
jgi:hypothetical protein